MTRNVDDILIFIVIFIIFFISSIPAFFFYLILPLVAILLFNKYKISAKYVSSFFPSLLLLFLILFFIVHFFLAHYKSYSYVLGTVISLLICLSLIQKSNYKVVERCIILFGSIQLFFAIWYLLSFSSFFAIVHYFLPTELCSKIVSFHSEGSNVGINSQTSPLALYLSLYIGVIYIKYQKKMNVSIILLLLIAFFIILTTSRRGALIFTSLGVLSLIGLVRKYSFMKVMQFVALTVLLSILFIYIVSASGIELSIFDRFNIEDIDFSDYDSVNKLSSSRLSLIVHAYNYFLESPIIGHGFKFFFDVKGQDVHNTFLQLLCESGIVGTSIILWFVFYNLIKTLKLILKNSVIEDEILFSFYVQFVYLSMFFIENPLSDRFCFLIYMVAIAFLYNQLLSTKLINNSYLK